MQKSVVIDLTVPIMFITSTLVILKFVGAINLPWLWVFFPIWGTYLLLFVIWMMIASFVLIMVFLKITR
jgi:hypothetical protein